MTVVNDAQADWLKRMSGFRSDRVFVVPNIVEEVFFLDGARDAEFRHAVGDYVLSTGNVCARKKQLALVEACRSSGLPLLLVGDVLTGEEWYAERIDSAIAGAANIRWLRGLPAGSDELLAAYRGAAVFALVSHGETQPISALEAVPRASRSCSRTGRTRGRTST